MNQHIPILTVVTPLLTALMVSFVGLWKPTKCFVVAALGLFITAILSVCSIPLALHHQPYRYVFGGWAAPYGIEFVLDRLNIMLLVLVAVFSFLSVLQSKTLVHSELQSKEPPYYILVLLLVAGLLGMSITGDAFNLYVMIEITSIATYALVAVAGGRAYISAFHYVIVGTIGGGFYLLGVGHLYLKTGTLNISDLQNLLPPLYGSSAITVGFSLMIVGLFLKMAFFPLHGWLSNAYYFAPQSVANLMAPLSTKVAVYVMIRVMFWIFSPEFVLEYLGCQQLVVVMASVAIIAGTVLALAERDVKRMFTYVIVAEVGYMVGGLWLFNQGGYVGAVFHIMNDVIMTSCIFMAISSVAYRRGNSDLSSFSEAFTNMPLTMIALVVAMFNLIGVPPTGGFISKWYLVTAGFESGHWYYSLSLISAGLMNAVLVFRVFERSFFPQELYAGGDSEEGLEVAGGGVDADKREAPASMWIPTMASAVLLIVIGVYSDYIIQLLILPTVPF